MRIDQGESALRVVDPDEMCRGLLEHELQSRADVRGSQVTADR